MSDTRRHQPERDSPRRGKVPEKRVPDGWVTDVPGLSRAQQLKLIGNGVCPQQMMLAILLLLPDVPYAQFN